MRLVIFDLTGVVFTKSKYKRPPNLPYTRLDFSWYQIWLRPGIRQCWQKLWAAGIETAIWTSNPSDRVEVMLRAIGEQLQLNLTEKMKFIWTRDDCVLEEHRSYKPIDYLWQKGIVTDGDKILMIDDSLEKHEFNNEHDLLILPSFRIDFQQRDHAIIEYTEIKDFTEGSLVETIIDRLS